VPAHADGLSWLVTEKKKTKTTTHCPWDKKKTMTHCPAYVQLQHDFISVREMLWRGLRVSCSLIAKGHQQVLRNVSAVVPKRCNSTAAVTQARPEEWDYAKPFEDIPGPKPLPIVGNTWRFIPFLGNITYCFVNPFKIHQPSESMQ
jgi:hypothetical protein